MINDGKLNTARALVFLVLPMPLMITLVGADYNTSLFACSREIKFICDCESINTLYFYHLPVGPWTSIWAVASSTYEVIVSLPADALVRVGV